MHFYTNVIDITPASVASDWSGAYDIPTGVPEGSTGVIVRVVNTDSAAHDFGLRKKGSTDEYSQSVQANSQLYVYMGVDSSGYLNGFIESTLVKLYLVGYFGSEAVFFTNSPTTYSHYSQYGSWAEKDASGDCPAGAVAAFFVSEPSGGGSFGVRRTGSSDSIVGSRLGQGIVVGLNTDRHFDMYSAETTNYLKIVGYLKSPGGVFLDSARVYNPSNDATFEDVDVDTWSAPENTIGVAIYVKFSSAKTFDFRKKGSTDSIYRSNFQTMQNGIACGVDEEGVFQVKVADADNTPIYIVGYFLSDIYNLQSDEASHTQSADAGIVSPHLVVSDSSHSQTTDCSGRSDVLLNGVMPNDGQHRHATDLIALETPYARGNIVLPFPECWGSMEAPGNADITFPTLEAEAYGGGTASIEIPMVDVDAEALWSAYGIADVEIPFPEVEAGGGASGSVSFFTFEVSASGKVGIGGRVDIEFPKVEEEAYSGASGLVTLPVVDVSSDGKLGIVGNAELVSPQIRVAAEGWKEVLCSADLRSPLPLVEGFGKLTLYGSANVELLLVRVLGHGLTGSSGQCSTAVPFLECSATGYSSSEGDGDVVFPALKSYLSKGTIVGRFDDYVLRYVRGEKW